MRSRDGRAVVVKAYSDLLNWKLGKELFVHGVLARQEPAVPLPAVLAADDSKALLNRSVLVLTKLDGADMRSLLDRLDESAVVALNRRVGEILRELHEIEFDAFGYVGPHGIVRRHATNLDHMRFEFERNLREFDALGGDPDLRRAIERHVADRDELFAGCARACFCHNDCHEGNLLVVCDDDEPRVTGVIDFENVVAGDPLLDLARTHCFSQRRSEATLAALAEGHGDLRDDWREALDLYVLHQLLELWDWFASMGEREALPGVADAMRAAVRA